MATKQELEQAIDFMVKHGQQKFQTEAERRVYAYGFVRSILVDIALQDSVAMAKIVKKYKKIIK